MTKEFWNKLTAALLGTTILGSSAQSAAQTCAVAPTCESLGYTMTATDCTGKKTLKCPFDTSKLYCVTEAGLANVNLGDVMFSDHTTGRADLAAPGKVAIGLVIGKTADSLIIANERNQMTNLFFSQNSMDVSWGNKSLSSGDFFTVYTTYTPTNLTSWDILWPAYNELKDLQHSDDGKKTYNTLIKWARWGPTGTFADIKAEPYSTTQTSNGNPWYPADTVITYTPVPQDLLIKGSKYYFYNDCDTFKTDGTSAGDWYQPSMKDVSNLAMAYQNLATGKVNQFTSSIGFNPDCGSFSGICKTKTVNTVDFSMTKVERTVNAFITYVPGSPGPNGHIGKYTANFYYKIPYYNVTLNYLKVDKNGGSEVVSAKDVSTDTKICITKIKM